MKICQVVASSGAGGLEKHVIELCNEMSKVENVTLVAPREMQAYLYDTVNFIPLNFNRYRYNPLLLWQLLLILKKGNFDIIHAQAAKAANLITSLRSWLSVKTVGTIHNNKIKRSKDFNGLSKVIAVSHGVAELFKEIMPVSVVYNGIKLPDTFNCLTKVEICKLYELDPTKPLLCSIGRLVPVKGYDLLIAAIKDINVNVLIVGEGASKQSLQLQIEELNLQKRVKLIGFRSDVERFIPGVDGIVISSRHEGFSYVFVEALLLKKRILSTDVPVANEILNRSLIMETTIESIRSKINEFIFDLDKWTQLMAPAFESVDDKFSLNAMVSGTLNVYREALKNKL